MRQEFTTKTKLTAFTRANGRCENKDCGRKIDNMKVKAEYHHMLPCNLGGGNDLENCQLLCTECHKTETKFLTSESTKSRNSLKTLANVRDKKKKKWPSRKFNQSFTPNIKQLQDL
jgi:5-methylcytosine-specific restriction endonuclease McrA